MVIGTKCPTCGTQSCTIPCDRCRDAGRKFPARREQSAPDGPPTPEQFQEKIDVLLAEKTRLTWIVFPGGGKNHVAAFESERDARDFADQKGYMVVQFSGHSRQ